MARINNLTSFLTDVASAIKEKTGDSTAIPAEEFDTKIAEIQTQGSYQTKSTTISTNGNYSLTPDQGYDAMNQVDISVNVPQTTANLQEKTITTNGEHQPDTGYDGFSSVNVAVPSQEVNNQDTTITQNGVYIPDTGYTGFGEVTVNVSSGSGGVKLFETEQAMQNDPDPSEGDLAVVYKSEIQPCTVTSQFSKAVFPETVVLDTALEDYVDLYFQPVDSSQSFDFWGQIDSNYFHAGGYGEDGEYRIEYESQDGITYTRTTFSDSDGDISGNEIDFGVTLQFADEPNWNDVIGKFIQIGGSNFEGLYKYGQISGGYLLSNKNNKILVPTNKIQSPTDPNYGSICSDVATTIIKVTEIDSFGRLLSGIKYGPLGGCYTDNGVLYGLQYAPRTYYWTMPFVVDWKNKTIIGTEKDTTVYLENDTYGSLNITSNDEYIIGGTEYSDASKSTVIQENLSLLPCNLYNIAPTQLTLSASNQLLPNKTALGATGVIVGDNSIYDNLNVTMLDSKYMTSFGQSTTSPLTINGYTTFDFGTRLCEKTLEPFYDINYTDYAQNHPYMKYKLPSQETSEEYTYTGTASYHMVLDYYIDTSENRITTYVYEGGLGQNLCKIISDMNMNRISKTTWPISNNEYILAAKIINNKVYMMTHVGAKNASGSVLLKYLDLSSGTITSIGTADTSVSYTEGKMAYDESLNLIYLCGRATDNTRKIFWGTINTSTNSWSKKSSSTSSFAGDCDLFDTKSYVFLSFNGKVYYFKKGSATQNTLLSDGRIAKLSYDEDDTYKYLYAYNYSNSSYISSKTTKATSGFGTLQTSSTGIDEGFRIINVNGVYYYAKGLSFYNSTDWTAAAYPCENIKWLPKIIITNDSIRFYGCGKYDNSETTPLQCYVDYNYKLKPLALDYNQTNEFPVYCYNKSKVIPFTNGYKDCIEDNASV